MTDANDGKNYEGLGGWLAVWLVFAVITLARMIFHVDVHMLSGDTWNSVTTPGTDYYNPFWKVLLVYEYILQFLNPLAWLGLIFLCISKNHRFPKIVIGFYIVSFFLILFDTVGAYYVIIKAGINYHPSFRELGRGVVGLCVWAPYFLRSKRVRATFI